MNPNPEEAINNVRMKAGLQPIDQQYASPDDREKHTREWAASIARGRDYATRLGLTHVEIACQMSVIAYFDPTKESDVLSPCRELFLSDAIWNTWMFRNEGDIELDYITTSSGEVDPMLFIDLVYGQLDKLFWARFADESVESSEARDTFTNSWNEGRLRFRSLSTNFDMEAAPREGI